MNKQTSELWLQRTKDWTLEVLHDDDYCKSFLLRQYPDTRVMSTNMMFVENRIIVFGDVAVVRGGVISDIGYDLNWFARHLDYDYLAEKFLKTKWVKEYAIEWWKEQLVQYKEELAQLQTELQDAYELEFPYEPRDWRVCGKRFENINIITALIEFIEQIAQEEVTADWIYENQPAYRRESRFYTYFDSSDGFGGYGYDPNELGWLYAIQHRFAEAYAELKATHEQNHPRTDRDV